MAKRSTKGKCKFCSEYFSGRGMSRHLKACKARESHLQALADSDNTFFLIKASAGPYWLFIEVDGSTTLKDLDSFFREIWVECCNHLSRFTINEVYYDSHPNPKPPLLGFEIDSRDMKIKLNEVLEPDLPFDYEYDFGTTTHLRLKVVSQHPGKVGGIQLVARNKMPQVECASCGQPATTICTKCLWKGKETHFCDKCIKEHECGEDMALPLVNSPRTGMCGYTG